MMSRLLIAAALCGSLVAGLARADSEITLREGGTLVAKSYRIDGDAIVVYRAAGEIRLQRSRVTNIRDLGATPAAARERRPAAPAIVPPDAAASPMPAAPSHSIVTTEDAAARDREVARASILAHRALLFAENRGEGAKEIERRKAAIAELETERASLRKRLEAH